MLVRVRKKVQILPPEQRKRDTVTALGSIEEIQTSFFNQDMLSAGRMEERVS